MNKRTLSMLYFLFNVFSSQGQGLNNLFMFGYNQNGNIPCNMNLFTGLPILSPSSRAMNLSTSNANITDSFGNLFFYTNGIYIADASNDTMQNGGGLNPCQISTVYNAQGLIISQSDLIIPKPANQSIYYLFHSTWDLYPSVVAGGHLFLSTIDMNGNGGLGTVSDKNHILLTDTITGGNITACKHANGRDWWVVVPEYPHPSYYVFLVTPDTIILASKQSIGIRTVSSGQMIFSKEGTKFGSYDATTDIEVFDFDRCTGVFSNPIYVPINDNQNGYGCCFSPDASRFYASSAYNLYQIDLTSINIPSSLDTVAKWDTTYGSNNLPTLFLLQELGLDDRIYIVTDFPTDKVTVIDSPNNLGVACNVLQHAITLPSINDQTLPNHPNYFLGPVVGSICDSLSTGIKELEKIPIQVKLYPNPANSYLNVQYDFGYRNNGWVELLDLQGRIIYKQRLYWSGKELLLHTNSYTNGIYQIRVSDDMGRSGSAKLVVQH